MANLYKQFKSFFSTPDTNSGIISFCKTEYGSDWFWAYRTFQNEGRFPSVLNRKH